jgi:signal peptidase I
MIEGESMEPAMHSGEIVMIDRQKLASADTLKRGEIVVFSFDGQFYYVKRVIGLPGEKIRINKDGVAVKIADKYVFLSEPYLLAERFNYGDERYFQVPEKSYFVLGDNRDHSKDSRYFENPYVSLENIYGKLIWEWF